MAIHNELQEGGLNRVLQARFQLLGAAPAPALAPELFPQLTLENDRPEWRALKNERYFSLTVGQSAVAGERSVSWWNSPAQLGQIVVIEQIVGTTDMSVGFAANFTPGASPVSVGDAQGRDMRLRGGTMPTTLTSSTPLASAPFLSAFDTARAGVTLTYPIILVPSATVGMLLRTTADNTALSAVVRGYVRPIYNGELG